MRELLTSQVAELRQQLQAAETAVTRYREEHHLTGAAKDSAGVSAQLAALNSQLITARADLAESEAERPGSAPEGIAYLRLWLLEPSPHCAARKLS